MIAASAVFAGIEASTGCDTRRRSTTWGGAGAGAIGFLGNEAVSIYRMRVGRRSARRRWSRTARTRAPTDSPRWGSWPARSPCSPASPRADADRRPGHHVAIGFTLVCGRAHRAAPGARRDRRADDALDRGRPRRRYPASNTCRRPGPDGSGTSCVPNWRSTCRRTSPSRPDTTSPNASGRRCCTTSPGWETPWSTSTRTSTTRTCRSEPVPSLGVSARTMAVTWTSRPFHPRRPPASPSTAIDTRTSRRVSTAHGVAGRSAPNA